MVVAVPVVWVALEYFRAHFPTGFPFLKAVHAYQMAGFGWYFLGYTQHDFDPLLQAADLGGVYLVSFAVAAVNGLVFEVVLRVPAVRRWLRWPAAEAPRRLILSGVAVGVLLGGLVSYGLLRLRHEPFETGPRVAAIQGSVPQDEKILRGDILGRTYYELCKAAAEQLPRPDLVVWPETCCPVDWYQLGPGVKPEETSKEFVGGLKYTYKELISIAWPTNVMYGLNSIVWEDGRAWKYNSAVMLDPSGMFRGRYDKIHLVPFGEYVPFPETFPWLKAFTPYTHDYSCRPGERQPRFELRSRGQQTRFGVLICYEDSDPYLARQYALPGPAGEPPADFLVNISNDGWFNGTEEHEQHLAICRFRAVEARRSVVRAVNMGVSAVIDPDGRVIALPGPTWRQSKAVEGIVAAEVPLDRRESAYAHLGDWVPAACWGFLAVMHFVCWRRKMVIA
jgi:apolipoprotein N-acyltransferase